MIRRVYTANSGLQGTRFARDLVPLPGVSLANERIIWPGNTIPPSIKMIIALTVSFAALGSRIFFSFFFLPRCLVFALTRNRYKCVSSWILRPFRSTLFSASRIPQIHALIIIIIIITYCVYRLVNFEGQFRVGGGGRMFASQFLGTRTVPSLCHPGDKSIINLRAFLCKFVFV